MSVHPVEKLWREVGLPEYFLGNGGTNTKLYALYDAIRALDNPTEAEIWNAAYEYFKAEAARAARVSRPQHHREGQS
jgi:hypothetical protein